MKTKKEILNRLIKYKKEKLKHNSRSGKGAKYILNKKIQELDWVLE